MIRTQLYLTDNEKKALTHLIRQTGCSQSELIRQAIDLLYNTIKNHGGERIRLLRRAKGIWKDKNQKEITQIRASMDRDTEGF